MVQHRPFRFTILPAFALAALLAACGSQVNSGDGGGPSTGGSSSSSSSSSSSGSLGGAGNAPSTGSGGSGGHACTDVSCASGSDGSVEQHGTCEGQDLSVACHQLGLTTTWECGCTKNGETLGFCETGFPGTCAYLDACCDKYFYPPAGCAVDGEACATTEDCCYSVCTSFGQCGCLPDAADCQADADCCGEVCNHLGKCGCFQDGASCQTDAECCGKSCDTATGTCVTTCQPAGAYCQAGSDCCSNTCNGFYCE